MRSFILFFFFKQKTAYEMRISDWSSDVCSSDLDLRILAGGQGEKLTGATGREKCRGAIRGQPLEALDVAVAIEIALSREIGDRERQQARREAGLQFCWIHYSHTLEENVVL